MRHYVDIETEEDFVIGKSLLEDDEFALNSTFWRRLSCSYLNQKDCSKKIVAEPAWL